MAASPEPSTPTSVLIVDDHVLVAESLRRALSAEDDVIVVGSANTAAAALELAVCFRPDVVLMDLHLPDDDGVTAAERILTRAPKTRVVILSAAATPEEIAEALAAGCIGYLEKTASLSAVVRAVRSAARGKMVLATHILEQLVTLPKVTTAPPGQITAREREVLELLAKGLSNHEIATELYISFHTTRAHVRSLLAKLGARSRLEAVAIARRGGILDGGSDRSINAPGSSAFASL